MKSVLFGILCFMAMNSLPTAAAEPQTVDPKLDSALLSKLPSIWVPGTPVPNIFNILIVAQDDRSGGLAKSGRSPLASRSDIIMVMSVNRSSRQINILSIYRDHTPSAGCEQRIGPAPNHKINGVYSIMGRRGFIPCIEGMLEELIRHLPQSLAPELLDRGRLNIHAFFEGTRSLTIKPLGQDVISIVSKNKAAFLSTYGLRQTSSALAVLIGGAISGSGPAYLLGSDLSEEQARKLMDPKYLTIELKERKIYPAGGYQRAFNFATATSEILGWAAYGIEQYRGEKFQFLGKFFAAAINKNMSRSHDFALLEKEVFMRDGDHLLRKTCFKKGKSPIRVIQWGESADKFTIYMDGKFSHSSRATQLTSLKYVDILPSPSDCN